MAQRRHRRPHPRSRLPRANTQEPRRTHGQLPAANDQQSWDRGTVNEPPPSSGQAVWSGWAFQEPHHVGGAFDGDRDGSHGFTEPSWQTLTQPYQPDQHDASLPAMSPTTSPADGTSTSFPETVHSQTVLNPSAACRPSQNWAVAAARDWTEETRRWSMQARQGSDVGLPGTDHYGNGASPTEHQAESSTSDGGPSPVDMDHYVRGCVGGEDAPWSPEFPYRGPGYQ
ncbi:hypothetical protein F4802DRAFT_466011 [Xylaria palmicola]|nr:hypothetical protein F4802DRAFT_466011 [Xylaria palmicola]